LGVNLYNVNIKIIFVCLTEISTNISFVAVLPAGETSRG